MNSVKRVAARHSGLPMSEEVYAHGLRPMIVWRHADAELGAIAPGARKDRNIAPCRFARDYDVKEGSGSPTMPRDENQTRTELIDPVLHDRGWTEDLIRRERTPVSTIALQQHAHVRKGRTDYLLVCPLTPGNSLFPSPSSRRKPKISFLNSACNKDETSAAFQRAFCVFHERTSICRLWG